MKRGRRRAKRWDHVERELRTSAGPMIAGVDEVGRGPLAGPVVACAVIMPADVRAIAGVDDSKQLTAVQRVRLARLIRRRALAVGLGAASAREIDRFNIYHATTIAIRRAVGRLGIAPDHVILDGRRIRSLDVPHTAIVGGDARCYSIACASIIAKVTRDRVMKALGKRYPPYGWERNVGYTTAKHLDALAAVGPTKHHRRSFMPVCQLALNLADRVPAADTAAAPGAPEFVVIDPAAALDLVAHLVAPLESQR